jgi:prepilin-type N-terminal cleavage/methylation domain-containing protein
MKAKASARGFSLIELLIAVTVALIVLGSALALMMSIMQANGQNITSTRLTQELRALTEIVARDVRRARYNQSAMNFVGEARDDDNGDGVVDINDWVPTNAYANVAISLGASAASDSNTATVDGQCIQYSYESAPGGAFRTISRQVIDGVGAIVLATNGAASPACDANGVRLSSPQVNVRLLAFNYNNAVSASAPKPEDWVRITVEANMTNDPGVIRRFSESVRFKNQRL